MEIKIQGKTIAVDRTELESLRTRIDALLAKPAPRLGDVVLANGETYICVNFAGNLMWRCFDYVGGTSAESMDAQSPTYRFNVLDVLNQGPVVIGLTVETAKRYRDEHYICWDYDALQKACAAALKAQS